MEDDSPVIYGLEFQARALSAQNAETDVIRFFVGTQSLKFENQIHQLDYDEENNSVVKTVYLHGAGEIWHLSTSPSDSDLLSTCYNQITSDGKCEMRGAIWRLPANKLGSGADDSSSSFPALELVTDLDLKESIGEFKNILWEPSSGKRLISLIDSSFHLWDFGNISKPVQSYLLPDQKGKQKFTNASWNPHHNCNILAAAIDTSVRSWDIRSMQPCWSIENAHGQLVRSLDFNPNKQYYLASCGDDCQTKFWDVRNVKGALLVLSDHSHWVWCVRYNSSHDQLVLTSSSDSRVILSRAASVSSEPFGHLIEDDIDENNEKDKSSEKCIPDGVISMYEEHEDSVYAVEWSPVDPWLFASLSYDGRLVINKVPRSEKFRILL